MDKMRLIDANDIQYYDRIECYGDGTRRNNPIAYKEDIDEIPTVDAVEVVHGQRLYNAHEVAEILAEAFGDPCACNFNGIDEWLPFKCELLDACPNPCGVACWEQYLKYRHCKNEIEAKEDGK